MSTLFSPDWSWIWYLLHRPSFVLANCWCFQVNSKMSVKKTHKKKKPQALEKSEDYWLGMLQDGLVMDLRNRLGKWFFMCNFPSFPVNHFYSQGLGNIRFWLRKTMLWWKTLTLYYHVWISSNQTKQLILKLQWTQRYRPLIIHKELLNLEVLIRNLCYLCAREWLLDKWSVIRDF